MTRILGIDPGSQITGYGIIDMQGGQSHYYDCGCIRTSSKQPLPERLKTIFQSINALIAEYRPHTMAIEQVFMHRNPDSALKLGQARGVSICAGVLADLPINEYAPRAIKQALVGSGGATKEQVQHMVCALLQLKACPQADAADALAIALCHGHTLHTLQRFQGNAALLWRKR
jgi:crossover junction endodeoxyribonuclease RuvC